MTLLRNLTPIPINDLIDRDELHDLINLLFDDRLKQDQARKLHHALRSSERNREIYLQLVDAHASLAWQIRWPLPIKAVVAASELHQESFDREIFENASWLEEGAPPNAQVAPGPAANHWFGLVAITVSVIAASIAIMMCFDVRRNNQLIEKPIASASGLMMGQGLSANEEPPVPVESIKPNLGIPVARIGSSVEAVWNELPTPQIDDIVRKGWIQLNAGTVRLDFFNGVRMIVQGPSRIEIRSTWEVFLDSGTVRCNVGEMGKGFRVQADGMDVVDLGTEFGMRVGPTGDPEVHVFSGKVALVDEVGNKKFEVIEQEAMQVSDGKLKRAQYSEKGFASVDEVARKASLESDQKFHAWQQSVQAIDLDPATLVHYTMQDQQRDDLKVVNRATVDAGKATDAIVIGCGITEGRWRKKNAIQFCGNGDRLLLAVDEPVDSVTMMMWLRIDNNNHTLMGLIMGEEPDRQERVNSSVFGKISERELEDFELSTNIKLIRWGVWRSGALMFAHFRRGAGDPNREWDKFNTAPTSVLHPSRQWNHIAVTFDSENRRIKQFVNGSLIHSWTTGHGGLVRLGNLAIGNLSVDDFEIAQGVSREFLGAIDEVVISSRVYSPEEIKSNYKSGKP
jgi:hypothetical protein